MSGFVYFICREGEDLVKIGWAQNNPKGRLVQLQTGCPEPLGLMAFFPGSRSDEARLHRTFATLRYRGEWFFNVHKLHDFINYLTGYDERVEMPEKTRELFEDAIWDVLVSGYDWPDRHDLERYKASADAREWHHLFPDEDVV